MWLGSHLVWEPSFQSCTLAFTFYLWDTSPLLERTQKDFCFFFFFFLSLPSVDCWCKHRGYKHNCRRCRPRLCWILYGLAVYCTCTLYMDCTTGGGSQVFTLTFTPTVNQCPVNLICLFLKRKSEYMENRGRSLLNMWPSCCKAEELTSPSLCRREFKSLK